MLGHILIIPKRHIEKITDLKNEELLELFEMIKEFQEIILDKLSLGCDLRQHYRPFEKQGRLRVNHLHFHLQPRKDNDELYKKSQIYEKQVFKDLSNEEILNVLSYFNENK